MSHFTANESILHICQILNISWHNYTDMQKAHSQIKVNYIFFVHFTFLHLIPQLCTKG